VIESELWRYQSAALEMCYRLGLDPYQPALNGGPPQWVLYAERMAEHAIMVETMRNFGVHPL
jgi:hypothetical protein